MFPGLVNFARLHPATRSSTANNERVASNAVDGDPVTPSATDLYDYEPWWKVDLAYPVTVTHVEIIVNHYTGGYMLPSKF